MTSSRRGSVVGQGGPSPRLFGADGVGSTSATLRPAFVKLFLQSAHLALRRGPRASRRLPSEAKPKESFHSELQLRRTFSQLDAFRLFACCWFYMYGRCPGWCTRADRTWATRPGHLQRWKPSGAGCSSVESEGEFRDAVCDTKIQP